MIEGVPELVRRWTGAAFRSSVPAATGAINQTELVETDGGRFALREYRATRSREGVAREHALIAFAAGAGVPAPRPLPLPGGGTLAERDGRLYALFEWAPGGQRRRADLGAADATTFGRALAHLQRRLAPHPVDALPDTVPLVPPDRAATIAQLDRLERMMRARPRPDALDRHLLRHLDGRRRWLATAPLPVLEVAALPAQTLHGDFQESNLFVTGGRVTAIIDWDQAHAGPRGWEVVRAMHLMWGFDPTLSEVFWRAYARELPMPLDELDAVGAAYAELRVHDLWAYRSIYDEGDDRVRRFFSPDGGGFSPLTARWALLRAALG
jgi:Ser/Thr protein kinase RdoA (MazF antagonist)